MNIITLISKRSVRETIKKKRFLKFYSMKEFSSGDMIEIIHGNKKTPAIILKMEPASKYKESIRDGSLEINKLVLSKTGQYANGEVYDHFDIPDIKKYLKNPPEVKNPKNKNLTDFFPQKKKSEIKEIKEKKKSGAFDISQILENKIIQKEKTYHNKMQEMVDIIRTYFNEKARYGFGSFSYYIGMFKQVPERDIWQFFAEAKQTKKSLFDKKKLFWYKMGKYIKEKNKKK